MVKFLAEVTVSDVDSEVVVKLSDLYDGLLLTKIKVRIYLTALKEFQKIGKSIFKVGHVLFFFTYRF